MNRILVIFLLCALGAAQIAPPQPAAPSPAVNLNDSDNARKARAVLDQTIQALGGQPYLAYENKEETGRYYPLYHGRTQSTGIPYNYYIQYPDKDRFEVIRLKDIHVIPGQIDIGGVKSKKPDLVLIHNGDKGYETTFKGTAAQDREDLENYPVKIGYSWRDPKDKQKNVEEEVYDNYKLVQGIWTPHSITRYFNGETSQQRFVNTATYNLKLPDSMFEAAVTYDPKAPPKKR